MKLRGALGSSGITDWVVQRATAVLITVYLVYLVCFFYSYSLHNTHSYTDYEDWVSLFKSRIFKFLTIIFLISLIKHAWIGVWTVATDYIPGFKLRTVFLFVSIVLCLSYLAWGFYILW